MIAHVARLSPRASRKPRARTSKHCAQPVAPDSRAPTLSAVVLRRLADERKIEASGSTVRLPGHNATANAADDRLWQTVRPALEASALQRAADPRARACR